MATARNAKSPFAVRLEEFGERWRKSVSREARHRFMRELMKLARINDQQMANLQEIMEQVEERYSLDPLTSLPNRRVTLEKLIKILSGDYRKDTTAIGVIFVDLDKFKEVNDKFGHAVGDLALACVGKIIDRSIKSGDSMERVGQDGEEGLGGRLGGDEFLVTVELKSVVDLYKVAKRLSRNIADPAKQAECGYTYSRLAASVGAVACILPIEWENITPDALAAGLIDLADRQMYKCKQTGLVSIRYYKAVSGQLVRIRPGTTDRQ